MKIVKISKNFKLKDIWQFLLGLVFVLLISYVSEEFIPGRLSMQKKLFVAIAVVGILGWIYKNRNYIKGKYWSVLCWFCIPFILSSLYTIVICSISGDSIGTIKQSITTSLFLVVDFFMVVAISYFFDKRTIIVMTAALIGAYVYVVFLKIHDTGIANTLEQLVSKGIERNDIGVAVVPLILYYCYIIFIKSKKIKFGIPLTIMLLAIMYFCGKRSAILSLAIGLTLIFVVKVFGKHAVLVMKIVSCLTILGCCLYVICIHSGVLDVLMLGKGTLSDRYYVWKHFDSIYEISPTYLGKGFGFIHRYMVAGLGNWMVNAYGYLHNSILQLYIETGFYGFCIWIGTYLLLIPYVAQKKYGKSACCFTIISIVSMFAMFTVDNTLTYPLYQICLYCSLYSIYHFEEIEQMRNSKNGINSRFKNKYIQNKMAKT